MNKETIKELFQHGVYKDTSKREVTLKLKDAPLIIEKAVGYYWRKDKTITKEDIEDTVMDVVMLAIEKGEDITEKTLLGRVRSRLTKLQYKNVGLTVRGTVPAAGGRKGHIRNHYDKFGNNLIEKTADKYMADPSQMAIMEEMGIE